MYVCVPLLGNKTLHDIFCLTLKSQYLSGMFCSQVVPLIIPLIFQISPLPRGCLYHSHLLECSTLLLSAQFECHLALVRGRQIEMLELKGPWNLPLLHPHCVDGVIKTKALLDQH
jgi:hypothetical protein